MPAQPPGRGAVQDEVADLRREAGVRDHPQPVRPWAFRELLRLSRAGDRGWSRPLTVAAHAVTILSFGLTGCGEHVGGAFWPPLAVLGLSAVLLDVGVAADQTLGRRAVNLRAPETRGRLNALFVGLLFLGRSAGSTAADYAWMEGGLPLVCAVGAGFGLLSLLSDVGRREASS